MQPDVSSYALFLGIGVAAVFIDGRFILRSGATYLEQVYADPKVAESVNRLITVLFHLAMLGVFALISVIPNDTSVEGLISRLGVMLLVMAAAHGLTIWAFARMRTRQREQQLQSEIAFRAETQLDDKDALSSMPRPSNKNKL